LKLGSFGWLKATFIPRRSNGFLVGRLAATGDLYKFGSFCKKGKRERGKGKSEERSPPSRGQAAAMGFLLSAEFSKSSRKDAKKLSYIDAHVKSIFV